MSHFLESDPNFSKFTALKTPWPGLRVMLAESHLFIQPTEAPLVKVGIPFIRLPESFLIFGKVQGGKRGEYRNLAGLKKRAWWISVNTVDPLHILIDWDGVSGLETHPLTGETSIVTPSQNEIDHVLSSKQN